MSENTTRKTTSLAESLSLNAPSETSNPKQKNSTKNTANNNPALSESLGIAHEKSQVTKSEVCEHVQDNMNRTETTTKEKTANNHMNKNIAEKVVETVTNSPEVEKAIGVTYKAAKNIVSNTSTQNKSKKAKKKKKYKQLISQDLIPIRSIRNGIIYTTNGKYVKILEILPINYYALNPISQDRITRTFANMFHENTDYMHIKCIVDTNNPQRLIAHIKAECEKEKHQRGISDGVIECAKDVINKIKRLSENNSLTKRFFLIYEYEGKSSNIRDICLDMDTVKNNCINIARNMGNTIIDVIPQEASLEQGEILYYFFNRKTSREHSLIDRITRITQDFNLYNESSAREKETTDVDFISTKGIHFKNPNYVYMDGRYITYFALRSKGHPDRAYPGWLDIITNIGEGTEVDIHIKKLPHDITLESLNQYNLFKTVSYKEKRNKPLKQDEIGKQINNNTAITQAMSAGEDLFEVLIIITISSDTIAGLKSLKSLTMKTLKTQKLYVEDSYSQHRRFFYSTMPLTNYSKSLFNNNKRNYLTSSLTSLYMFTSLEMNDPTGNIWGINTRNNSIVSINLFNTQIFPNANVSIYGQSGCGKTYSSEVIARGMRVNGFRVFFILPIKGHEYLRGSKSIGGNYIKLGPGSKDVINIMEIRPEQKINLNELSEDIAFKDTSLLAKKIATLTTWLQLICPQHNFTIDEIGDINSALMNLYNRFGITEDNDSIYEDASKTTLKLMPIIEDMYDEFREHDTLHYICKMLDIFVSGSCRNMNAQTNVDLTNKYTVFDVDERSMAKELLSPFLFIVITCIYDLVRENRLYHDVIFADELWKIMNHPAAGEQIGEMVRVIRGYGGSIVAVTQDINAYLRSEAGETILSNTDTKLILKLKETECRRMAKELNLSEEEQENIINFSRGDGLLLAGRNRIYIHIEASQKEDEDFTTDPNRLRELAQRGR